MTRSSASAKAPGTNRADWLHDDFSCHTEHHVFPTMNPRFYPEVSQLLQTHFPDRYQRLTFAKAWRRRLWRGGEFIVERGGGVAKNRVTLTER